MKMHHWIGAIVILVIGYYLGTKGILKGVMSKISGAAKSAAQ